MDPNRPQLPPQVPTHTPLFPLPLRFAPQNPLAFVPGIGSNPPPPPLGQAARAVHLGSPAGGHPAHSELPGAGLGVAVPVPVVQAGTPLVGGLAAPVL